MYKWLLLLAIPVCIFLFFLFSLIFTPVSIQNGDNALITPTSIPARIPERGSTNEKPEDANIVENNFEEDLDSYENLINKELLPDGSTKYSFDSGNPERPDITMLTNDNKMLFYRRVSVAALPIISPSFIKETFGQPERIIAGSQFYGKDTVIYLYAASGVAFIVNPQINETYEEQRFQPMTSDAYLQRFGNQN